MRLVLFGILCLGISFLVASTLLADDWPTLHHDNAHTGRSSASLAPLDLTYSWSPRGIFRQATIVGDELFAFSFGSGASLYSFDLESGRVNWSHRLDAEPYGVPVVEGNRIVYAAGGDIHVHDQISGEELYSFYVGVGAPLVVEPATDGQNMFAYYHALSASRLGPTSGEQILNVGTGVRTSLPTVVDDSVVVAESGHFWIFDRATGARNRFNNQGSGLATIPSYDETRKQFYIVGRYSSTIDGAISAFRYDDYQNVELLWQRTGSGFRGESIAAIADDGSLYLANDRMLTVLDPATGATLRSTPIPTVHAYPILSDGYVWFSSSTATYAYDMQTLDLVRTFPRGQGGDSAIRSLGAIVDDHFVAFNSDTGFDVYAVPSPDRVQTLGMTRFREPTPGSMNYVPSATALEVGFQTTRTALGSQPLARVDISVDSAASLRVLVHQSVAATTVFDAVDLDGMYAGHVLVDLNVVETDYESDDFARIYITNGTTNIDVVHFSGAGLNSAAGAGFIAYEAAIPDDWTSVILVMDTSSNSSTGAERFEIRDIRITAFPVPEPQPEVLLFAAFVSVAASRCMMRSTMPWAAGWHCRVDNG